MQSGNLRELKDMNEQDARQMVADLRPGCKYRGFTIEDDFCLVEFTLPYGTEPHNHGHILIHTKGRKHDLIVELWLANKGFYVLG